MNNTAKSILTFETAKELVATSLADKAHTKRNVVVKRCLDKINFSKDDLKDKSTRGKLNICKSILGNAIEELVKNELVKVDENYLLYVEVENAPEEIKLDDTVKNTILRLLKDKALTKKELIASTCEQVRRNVANLTKDEQMLSCDTGRLLSVLVKEKQVVRANNKYLLVTKTDSETKNSKTKPVKTHVVTAKMFFDKLKSIASERFVNYSIELIAKFLENNSYKVISRNNIDGPDDGGIDGIIEAEDGFGYKQTILIQVKHREKDTKYIPLAEVREFYGVIAAEDSATKGLFITNSTYHSDTLKYAKKCKQKYFLLIDKKNLFDYAVKCHYGIVKKGESSFIDEELFD